MNPCSRTSPPAVSVIIAARDAWQDTFRCLMAVAQRGDEVTCETIVLDDASTDDTRLALPRLEGVTAARSDAPVGRPRSLAAGAGIAKGRYLLFLSQHAEPQRDWLAPLVEALDADPSLAAVGPVLLDAAGAIESAGIGLAYAAPLPVTPFPLDHGGARASVRPGAVPALSGACLLVRADAFRAAGGIDEGYADALEDLDLCFRLAEGGGRLALEPRSAVVLHHAPDWQDLGSYGSDLVRLQRTWAGRIPAYTVDRRATARPTAPRPGRPPISVVVPTQNALAGIASVVEDLALNLGPADEIVISDSGSSDGTTEYARAFVRDHPALARLVENDPAAGLAGAARNGLATARRPFAALVHTAVSLAPGFLDDATELLARNPGASALAVPMNGAGVYAAGATVVLRDVATATPQAFFSHGTDDLARRFAERGARVLVVRPDAPGSDAPAVR